MTAMADFLGRGPSFPLTADSKDQPAESKEQPFSTWFAWSEGEEKVKQSICLILSTAPGERVMRPDFGCGIHDLVFEPSTPTLRTLIMDRVKTALTRWEPRIDVLNVDVTDGAGSPQLVLVDITYRLRSNNAVNNLVYPFYLQEGVA
jgi:phage baseplate assembly protein W